MKIPLGLLLFIGLAASAQAGPLEDCASQSPDLKKLVEGVAAADMDKVYAGSTSEKCRNFYSIAATCADVKSHPSVSAAACWRNMAEKKKIEVNSELLTGVSGKCGNDEIFDNNECKKSGVVDPKKKPAKDEKKKDEKAAKDDKKKDEGGGKIDDDKNAKAKTNATADVPPAHGDHEAKPDKPDDPNKWNSTIAGGKMAIWAGLIGFILGGPMGMMLAAAVGFGAGYFIKEMS